MSKYIEREAAINEQKRFCGYLDNDMLNRLEIAMGRIPAADVRPVVRGKWVDEPIKGVKYHCSVCQGRFDYTWHYCPNCGADMRGES